MREPWNVATVEQVPYGTHHDEARTDVFIQWKGTDVCLDYYCECGEQSHFDGYFAYRLKCPYCGLETIMPATIYPLRVADAAPDTFEHTAVVMERGDD